MDGTRYAPATDDANVILQRENRKPLATEQVDYGYLLFDSEGRIDPHFLGRLLQNESKLYMTRHLKHCNQPIHLTPKTGAFQESLGFRKVLVFRPEHPVFK